MRKYIYTFLSIFTAVSLAVSPIAAFAQSSDGDDSGMTTEEIAELLGIDPEALDIKDLIEESEIKTVDTDKLLTKLKTGDPKAAASFLLKNDQGKVIERTPSKESTEEFPEKFDLRDRGVVTPVKSQSPWGTCWGFSAIAAAETSILTSLGKTYDETGLDLSEHHLAYFARTHMDDGSDQDGEGIYMLPGNDDKLLNVGGGMFTATSVFSSGIGVVEEAVVPYRGKNSKADGQLLHNVEYSKNDDWSLPDEYKFVQKYQLINADVLPSPAVYRAGFNVAENEDIDERNAAYLGYDQTATDKIKRALMDGKAVSIAFAADTYMPVGLIKLGEPVYLNTDDNKWTHYTYDSAVANHAVTIVGWDDTIKSTDFLDHSDEAWNADGKAHQPEGDGAWIVKNSWGSATEEFPNKFSWGIKNDEGKSTGYFYISYYDRSLESPEIFDFDTNHEEDIQSYIIDQYDFLQSDNSSGWVDTHKLSAANVFIAEYDEILRALSCETNSENASVEFRVYLLDDEATSPEDGELAAEVSADFEYAGYHRVKVDAPVTIKKGQKYSVVTTQTLSYKDNTYYAVSTNSTETSKEAVEEANRKTYYEHRGESVSSFEDKLITFYSVGVVNPGESYLYLGENDTWNDFSAVIPELKKYPEYKDCVYDNFPIKAYLDFADTAVMASVSSELPELGYADPAGDLNYRFIFACAAVIIVLVLIIVLKVRRHRKWRRMKKQLKNQETELAVLNGIIADMKKKQAEPAEQAEPTESSKVSEPTEPAEPAEPESSEE